MKRLKIKSINHIICLTVLILFSGLKNLSAQNYNLTENINNYGSTMTITAIVKDKEAVQHNVEIGVFIGDECRCVRSITGTDEKLFLTVKGEDPLPLYFKIYLHGDNEKREVTLKPDFRFKSDSIVGSSSNPYVIQLDHGITTHIEITEKSEEIVKVYPTINNGSFFIETQESCFLSVFDLNGNKVHSRQIEDNNEWIHLNVPTGIYILRIDIADKGKSISHKIIINK